MKIEINIKGGNTDITLRILDNVYSTVITQATDKEIGRAIRLIYHQAKDLMFLEELKRTEFRNEIVTGINDFYLGWDELFDEHYGGKE
jgi:hypothetical protein